MHRDLLLMAEHVAPGAAVMVVVAAVGGSTPRAAGARMLVRRSGPSVGTVGGGSLEAEAERAARDLLARGGGARLLLFDLRGTGPDAEAICGGKVELLLQPL